MSSKLHEFAADSNSRTSKSSNPLSPAPKNIQRLVKKRAPPRSVSRAAGAENAILWHLVFTKPWVLSLANRCCRRREICFSLGKPSLTEEGRNLTFGGYLHLAITRASPCFGARVVQPQSTGALEGLCWIEKCKAVKKNVYYASFDSSHGLKTKFQPPSDIMID